MSDNKKTMISLITALLSLAVSVLISFFLSRFIVKELGEEANGFAQLANNFVSYATLITIALNSMAGRFITISYHRGETEKCGRYYSSVIIGNIAILCLLILPAVICVLKLESLVNIETADINHVKLLFACVFANFFISQYTGLFAIAFFVKNSQYLQNIINMLRTLLNAGGLLAIFTVLSPKIYYVSLIGLILTGLSVPVYYHFRRSLMPDIRFSTKSFDIKCIKEMLVSGFWNTVTQCGNLLMTGFDLLLSDLFISPVRMGVLAIAKTVPTFITNLGVNVNTTFAPGLTIAYASSDKKRILASLRYAMKCSSFIMSIPIMALCVYGSDFYSLWMPAMNAKELSRLSLLTCAAFIPLSGTQTLYNTFTVTNKLKINSISIVAGGAVNILMVYFLLKYTSLELYAVAGVSSLVSILRNLLITVPYSANILGLKWYVFYKDVGISLICCAVSGGICFLFKTVIVPASWTMLFVSAAPACIVSTVLLFAVLLNNEEKNMILTKLRLRRKNNG